MLSVFMWFSAMANIAIPCMPIRYRAVLACVSRASVSLSKHGFGAEPLFCLDIWDRGRACASGGGGGVENPTSCLNASLVFGVLTGLWCASLLQATSTIPTFRSGSLVRVEAPNKEGC